MRHLPRLVTPLLCRGRSRFRPLPTCLVLVAALLAARPAGMAAQSSPLIVEFRGGAALPVGSFRDGTRDAEGARAGPSFTVDVALAQGARRSLTFGFSQHRFDCREAGCDSDAPYIATGINAGMRVNLRTTGDVIPWIRLAGRSVRVELPKRGSRPEATSELGFGGEVGVGLYVGAFGAVAFNPGVRFTATNTELPGGELLRLRHVVADLGLALAF